jgi:SAM-dependent methyltransferase
VTDPLKAQYEAYPYPARDPADESKRLIEGSPSHLLEIDHYVFAGRRDWRQPFRALIAGGGTGDAAIMLAQHLIDRGYPGEVVYLDLSSASRRIAEARAARRRLTNIRFCTASMAEWAGDGTFDYIDCCGVLHHLEDPAAGLRRLTGWLAPGGGMGLMLYGAVGRTGVYDLQYVLKRLADDLPETERLRLARKLVRQVPETNWLRRNPAMSDHLDGSEAGLYDLLLHRRDRAYLIEEVGDLIAAAGLSVASLIEPVRYRPATYVNDPALLRRADGLDFWVQAGLAERLAGNIAKHILYVVRRDRSGSAVASPEADDLIPVFRGLDPLAVAKGLKPSGRLTASIDGLTLSFPLPALAPTLARHIDGRTAIGELHRTIAANVPRLTRESFDRQFGEFYAAFNGINRLLLTSQPLLSGLSTPSAASSN